MQTQEYKKQFQSRATELIQISQMVRDLPITNHIKLKAQSATVAKLAFDKTIILTHPGQKSKYIVAHYSSNEQLISSIEVEDLLNLTMLNDHQVLILCQGSENRVVNFTLWNLHNQRLVKFSVEQLNASRNSKKGKIELQSIKHTMHFFSKSNLFVYTYNYSIGIQVFYFKLPLTDSCDPFHIFDFNFIQNKYTAKVIKMNELSKIAFIPMDNHSQEIFFTTYSLHKDSPRPLQKYSFKYLSEYTHSIGRTQQKRLSSLIRITDICQLKNNIFYIQVENMQNYQQDGYYYNIYYSNKMQMMIKSKLDHHIQGPFRIQFIEYLRQDIQVYEKRKKEKGFRNIPILYVSQQTEQILSSYTPPDNALGNIRIHWPKYTDLDYILQYQFNYFEAKLDIKIRMASPVWFRSFFSTFFLLEKDEDTDQDLLQQVHQLIKEGNLQLSVFNKVQSQIESLKKDDSIGGKVQIMRKRQELKVLRQFAFREVPSETMND